MSRQGEARPRTIGAIKTFWDAEATEWGDSPQVTIRDHYFRLHEIHTLLAVMPKCNQLLDIGCGTGFGTMFLAHRSRSTLGADYSPQMISWAKRLAGDPEYRSKVSKDLPLLTSLQPPNGELDFVVADVLDLTLPRTGFDCITGQRILINLPTHDEQLRALGSLRAVAAGGAQLVLVEATQEGHRRTDEYRHRFGLPILEKYWHNNYVASSRINEWETVGWRVEQVLHFDTYALLSKVIYPAAVGHDRCSFLSGANAASMEVSCVFRTRSALDELGVDRGLALWLDRVRIYDAKEADAIARWLLEHSAKLGDWSALGHQELFIARAI